MSSPKESTPAHAVHNEKDETSKSQSTNQQDRQTKQPLALPAIPTEEEAQKLNVDPTSSESNTFKLDHLGPMVVNSDGSLSRIHNWAEMSDLERERTSKVLGRRNQLRRAALEEKEGAE